MKLSISTGQTKAPSGTVLVPIVLGDAKSERVFLLIHTEGRPEGADNLKEECISVLTHVVVEGQGEAYTRLESALKELNGLLKGFLLSDAVKDVHAIVGVLEQDGNFHLSHVGRAEAYLIRDGSAAQITEYSRGKPPAAFMHIVSGPLQERDHVILSTQRLLRSITPAQLSQIVARDENALRGIASELEGEKETACLAHVIVEGGPTGRSAARTVQLPARRGGASRRQTSASAALSSVLNKVSGMASTQRSEKIKKQVRGKVTEARSAMNGFIGRFLSDLSDPQRKRRAHLLLLAGGAAVFLIIWMTIQLTLNSQKNQSKGELQALMQQINADIATAENRQLGGDTDSANKILQRAEDRARQVMGNESGLYRSEALEILDRINSKREDMNKVSRVTAPQIMANLSAKKPDIQAQGFLGLPNGEFVVYDRQDLYRVSLNTVEPSDRISGEELILDADLFPRFQSRVFMTTGNGIIETLNGQATSMKTEDTEGWVTGVDMKTYLRYLYVLAPERKQIYKYERLSSRYGPPVEYNVSGDLTGALDMTIAGPVYVLKDTSQSAPVVPSSSGGAAVVSHGARDVLKLLRGEKQTFNIRNLPPNALDDVTKIFKSSPTGNFYFLDPDSKRIVVTTNDGDLGDSLYLKQYVLDSDQVGKLKDIYVDPEDTRLYVLDEKKLYVIDLQGH